MKKPEQISRKGIKAWMWDFGDGAPIIEYREPTNEERKFYNCKFVPVLIIPQRVHSKGGKKR